MSKENVNVNQTKKGCQPRIVDTKKPDGNEQKPICQLCQPLSHDNACMYKNAHETRDAQEDFGKHIAREVGDTVDREPESAVERHLVKACKAHGWLTFKFTSPGNKGVPDRLLVLPNGFCLFIELKRPKGGRLSKMQEHQIRKLLEMDAFVAVLWSKRNVDAFMHLVERGRYREACLGPGTWETV